MKWVGIVTCLILLTTVVSAQQITVEGYRSNTDTDFSAYRTYYWASQVDNEREEGNAYFLKDMTLKQEIRDAVSHELEARGYKEEEMNPDLVVNFRVLDEPATLRGYDSYGTTAQMSGRDDVQTYEVEAGTLLVSLLDRESGDLVWQGFASGLLDGDSFAKDDSRINEAVHLIFEEYGFSATDLTSR